MEFIVSHLEYLDENYRSLSDLFDENIVDTERLTIAVGYASYLSLKKLDEDVKRNGVKHVDLILGMYYAEGMPDALYGKAMSLAKSWSELGIGNVWITVPISYHGKVYLFEKKDGSRRTVIGSANLTEINPPVRSIQCETAVSHDDDEVTGDIVSHLTLLKRFVVDIRDITNMAIVTRASHVADSADTLRKAKPERVKITRTGNRTMEGVKGVLKMSAADLADLRAHRTGIRFDLPLKVPTFSQRFSDARDAYAHSNINVCYSKPRKEGGKGRSWYEFQLTVSTKINTLPGYPDGNEKFWLITDDGWIFLAHVTSGNNNRKQLSAVGNELLLGSWVKGRLASYGLVEPQADTLDDPERKGLITREILDDYGCDSLTIEKTDRMKSDDSGNAYAVWLISFLPDITKKAIEEEGAIQ